MKTLFDIATDVDEMQLKLENVKALIEMFLEYYEDEGYISPRDEQDPEVDLKKIIFVNRLPTHMKLLEISYMTIREQIKQIEITGQEILEASREAKRV